MFPHKIDHKKDSFCGYGFKIYFSNLQHQFLENKRVILIQAFLKGTLVTTLPIKGYGYVSSNETTGLCQKEVKWLVKYTQIKQMAKFLLTFREFVKNCFQVLIMVKTVNHIQKQKF